MDTRLTVRSDGTVALSVEPASRDNYEAVNEYPGDITGDYVYAENGVTQTDIYGLTDQVTGLSLVVSEVTVVAIAQDNGAGANTLRLAIETGGVVHVGDEEALSTDWEEYRYTWSYNPETIDWWTVSDIASLQAGVRLTAAAGQEARVCQVYVEIEATILGKYSGNVMGLYAESPVSVDEGVTIGCEIPGADKAYSDDSTAQVEVRCCDGSEVLRSGRVWAVSGKTVVLTRLEDSTIAAAGTGKMIAKPALTMPGDEVMTGRAHFINIRSTYGL